MCAKSVWIRKRAPNTMNRDEGAYYLNHVYDLHLTTPISGDRRSRRLDLPPCDEECCLRIPNCQYKLVIFSFGNL